MSDLPSRSRSDRLDTVLSTLLADVPELEAASIVTFDGLAMAAALPPGMDEDRVAAMCAALLSLGERAAQGLGRGELSQVYIEGAEGTVFLVSAEDEAVLVAVAAKGAKAGMMLYEVRHAAAAVADVLRSAVEPEPEPQPAPVPATRAPEPLLSVVPPAAPVVETPPAYSPPPAPGWSTYSPSMGSSPASSGVLGGLGGSVLPVEPPRWS